jgi:hypothetical protein
MGITIECRKMMTSDITPTIDDICTDYAFGTCNGFAWSYKADHPHVEVRDALVNDDFHCYIYDPRTDCIIDPMLHQFDDLNDGVFDGDTHPHIDHPRDVRTWDNHDDFITHYDKPFGPYILNK